MKNGKKWFLGAATLLLGVLSGCGHKNKITMWIPLTGEDGGIMDQMLEEYNDTDLEFPVEHVVSPDLFTQIYQVMSTVQGQTDLSIIHADRVSECERQCML